MGTNYTSVITSPTIFGPVATKLGHFETRLSTIIKEIKAFNPLAYNSISEFIHGFKQLREDIKKDMSQLSTTFTTAQASLNASVSAGSASGAALAMKVIVQFFLEVADFVKCIEKIGRIIADLVILVTTLITKIAELSALLVKLAVNAVMAYLKELANDVVTVIADIKNTIVSWVQTSIFDPMALAAKRNIKSTQQLIDARKQALTNAGEDPRAISIDPQILAWKESINFEEAIIKELADLGLASGNFII